MTIRNMINKLEVLEEIINAIDTIETAHRQEATRLEKRYDEDQEVFWLDMSAVDIAKADHCRAYRDMLIKHEIK